MNNVERYEGAGIPVDVLKYLYATIIMILSFSLSLEFISSQEIAN